MPKKETSTLRVPVLRLARIHFWYVLAFALSIIVYDAWALITPDAVLGRWTATGLMLVITTVIWHLSRSHHVNLNPVFYKLCVYVLVLMDIAIATFIVYAERGMASRGVALYAIPIAVSAVLASRSALYATASLSAGAYWFWAVRYFVVNFNEGYKIELYSTLAFYSATFFVLAALLSLLVQMTHNKR